LFYLAFIWFCQTGFERRIAMDSFPLVVCANPKVGIVMGSESDAEFMIECAHILKKLEIPFESQVCSAHRNPDQTLAYAKSAESRGLKVIVAGAGMAAALPGLVAACTTLPVIGVPLPGSSLQGMDALLSIVQMPGGVPVATMAIGKAGAKNAAWFAHRILSL
jgi:5-(carboxyamino)imidazole ribonucleotide mutase